MHNWVTLYFTLALWCDYLALKYDIWHVLCNFFYWWCHNELDATLLTMYWLILTGCRPQGVSTRGVCTHLALAWLTQEWVEALQILPVRFRVEARQCVCKSISLWACHLPWNRSVKYIIVLCIACCCVCQHQVFVMIVLWNSSSNQLGFDSVTW